MWSRKSSKKHRNLWWPGASLDKVSEQTRFLSGDAARKKDLVIAMLGVARSEIRALSGAGMDDLVALETWQER